MTYFSKLISPQIIVLNFRMAWPGLGVYTNIPIFIEILRSFRDIQKIVENFEILSKFWDI